MNGDYVLLMEKEALWAGMLMQVLEDNGIQCTSLPVHGAGVIARGGFQDRLEIYVPAADKEKAEELVDTLFCAYEDLF